MALIYGELNVDVPNLSLTEIEQFISDTTEFHESTHSKEEKVYVQRNNRNYPWDRRVLEFNGKEFYNYKSINPFKKIKNIIETLLLSYLRMSKSGLLKKVERLDLGTVVVRLCK